MKDILFEILKELKIIRKYLEVLTKHNYSAGQRFNF